MKLQKMLKMTKENTHIVLYDGSKAVAKLGSPILFDGLNKDIDLKKYGGCPIVYTAGAADQPCGVLFWIEIQN